MAYLRARITCNFCGKTRVCYQTGLFARFKIRRRLKRDGWLTKGPRDVCPLCAAKGVRP